MHFIITVILVCLVSVFFPFVNASIHMLDMFVMLNMGIYAVFCMYFTIVVFYHFSDYGGVCLSILVFLVITFFSVVTAVLGDVFLFSATAVGWPLRL